MSERLELSEIQGLILSGYGERPAARYALFEVVDQAKARRFLARLEPRMQFGEYRSAPRGQPPFLNALCINLAFTHAGLTALGLDRGALLGFSLAFQEGASDANRARRLGDDGPSDPSNWVWGAPGQSLHGLLAVFGGDDTPGPEDYELIRQLIEEELTVEHGVRVLQVLDTTPAERTHRKEHFGFRDGITNPKFRALSHGEHAEDAGIADGEFLLGYENAYGKVTLSPEVPTAHDLENRLPTAAERSSHRDFGRNGSYLVFRTLEQKVPQFWQFVHAAKDTVPEAPSGPLGDEWLAARFIGRWRNGTPLTLYPHAPGPDAEGGRDDFAFHELDAYGERCPIGAHIRRTHPRDTSLPVPHDPELSNSGSAPEKRRELADRHRILRRGRSYGEPLDPNYDPEAMRRALPTEHDERGVHFLCFNANLSRQFEFVQSNWAANPAFAGLSADPDPLLAVGRKYPYSASNFTIQGCPTRRVRGLPRVVETRGAAYFFMPSRSAIRYLGSL